MHYLWRLGGKGNFSMVPVSNTLEFSMKSFSCEEDVCDIEKKEESMEHNYIFIFVMENSCTRRKTPIFNWFLQLNLNRKQHLWLKSP